MSNKLDNYLRMYRKRTGLSQGEVAFLLGSKCGTKVSRYEQFRRYPTLETTLALEVIFGALARDLFAGIHQQVVATTAGRAFELLQNIGDQASTPLQVQKIGTLRGLTLNQP